MHLNLIKGSKYSQMTAVSIIASRSLAPEEKKGTRYQSSRTYVQKEYNVVGPPVGSAASNIYYIYKTQFYKFLFFYVTIRMHTWHRDTLSRRLPAFNVWLSGICERNGIFGNFVITYHFKIGYVTLNIWLSSMVVSQNENLFAK